MKCEPGCCQNDSVVLLTAGTLQHSSSVTCSADKDKPQRRTTNSSHSLAYLLNHLVSIFILFFFIDVLELSGVTRLLLWQLRLMRSTLALVARVWLTLRRQESHPAKLAQKIQLHASFEWQSAQPSPSQVSQLSLLSLSSFRGRRWVLVGCK